MAKKAKTTKAKAKSNDTKTKKTVKPVKKSSKKDEKPIKPSKTQKKKSVVKKKTGKSNKVIIISDTGHGTTKHVSPEQVDNGIKEYQTITEQLAADKLKQANDGTLPTTPVDTPVVTSTTIISDMPSFQKHFDSLPIDNNNTPSVNTPAHTPQTPVNPNSSIIEQMKNQGNTTNPVNTAPVNNSQNVLSQMRSYGESIMAAFNAPPKYGRMTYAELQKVLTDQVLKIYQYEAHRDAKGLYFYMICGEHKLRFPENEYAFFMDMG